MYRAIRRLAKSKNVFDAALVRSSEEITVLIEVATRLRVAGMIRELSLAEGRWSNYYTFKMNVYKGSPVDQARTYLVPLVVEKFGVALEDFDKRKNGLYLADIRAVVPSNKKLKAA